MCPHGCGQIRGYLSLQTVSVEDGVTRIKGRGARVVVHFQVWLFDNEFITHGLCEDNSYLK